jgi:hypothetical protein
MFCVGWHVLQEASATVGKAVVAVKDTVTFSLPMLNAAREVRQHHGGPLVLIGEPLARDTAFENGRAHARFAPQRFLILSSCSVFHKLGRRRALYVG